MQRKLRIVLASRAVFPDLPFRIKRVVTIEADQSIMHMLIHFVAGGFGAAIELHDCAITAAVGASFGPVLAAPVPFAFVSNLSGTGLVALTCTRQQTDGDGQLSCTETRNGTVASTRSWDLLCPALPPDFIMASDFEDAPP